jgi:hypothetical protein
MTGANFTSLIDPSARLATVEWLDQLEDIGVDHGHFEPLGPDHSAVYIEGGPCLLVTFETIETARGRAHSDVPLGWELAHDKGWSQLCILSHSETWFRHRALYEYFDRLVDDGFFDDFDRVVFYGAGSCGYAAAAYSVAAPGASVIAVQPQATLDPRVTEWDHRFNHMRRVSFTDRYGYAPDLLDAAQEAFILYDPEVDEDAAHAALFTRPAVTKVRCRYVGPDIQAAMLQMKILSPLIDKAMSGTLIESAFHTALRQRRSHLPYLRHLLSAVEQENRPFLSAIMCRSVLPRINTPRFRRHLTRALLQLGELGRPLPGARSGRKATQLIPAKS